MESSSKTLISELNKTDTKTITGALEDISNASEEPFMEICLSFNFSSFISSNIKNKQIIDKTVVIIEKAFKLKKKNMIELIAKGCGGCFLCCLFLIISNHKFYENIFYNMLIEYLGDVNGDILEPKSFTTCCQRTEAIYQSDSQETEVCKRLQEGVWGGYVKGLGVLIADDYFISRTKEDAKMVNTLIETFIIEKNGFDILKAKDFINKLKENK